MLQAAQRRQGAVVDELAIGRAAQHELLDSVRARTLRSVLARRPFTASPRVPRLDTAPEYVRLWDETHGPHSRESRRTRPCRVDRATVTSGPEAAASDRLQTGSTTIRVLPITIGIHNDPKQGTRAKQCRARGP